MQGKVRGLVLSYDMTKYQRCIGSLMYLMVCTRLDIAFAVGVFSCHVASPGNVHMLAVKHVFRYLHGTSKYRLVFCANDSIDSPPIVYVDSDWAGDWADRKSISGFTILLDGGAISWGSKKQSSVLLSTVKAEFIAALTVVKEVLWHRTLFCSLNMMPPDPTRVLIDNQGALDLIKSGQINDRTKHIDTKFRHICNREMMGDIKSEHVSMKHQVADIMTKSLGKEKFLLFRGKIGVKL